MAESFITDSMLDMFIYETDQMLEQLEITTLERQKEGFFDEKSVNEIFRFMHTIKGSSAVMMYTGITTLTHKLEDVFYYMRESKPTDVPNEELIGYILDVSDFVKTELEKIKDGKEPDGDSTALHDEIDAFLERLKNHITKSGNELPPENVYVEPQQYYIAPVANEASHFFRIDVRYVAGTEMSNIRAYTAVFNLKELAEDILFYPEDIVSNPDSGNEIMENGFIIALQTQSSEKDVLDIINQSSGIESVDMKECSSEEYGRYVGEGLKPVAKSVAEAGETSKPVSKKEADNSGKPLVINLGEDDPKSEAKPETKPETKPSGALQNPLGNQPGPQSVTESLAKSGDNQVKKAAEAKAKPQDAKKDTKHEVQSYISVNVNKMDELMDMIGELVISQAFVLQNPDLKVPGLDLTNFSKAAAQMSRITSDLQDLIMSMRMMPLANTFQKMNRIVFDVSRKLGKDVDLKISGESTEMDKNIIENISDPLMHLIRNSVDHGIESKAERLKAGKSERGTVWLEAKNEGGKAWVTVRDDGAGMNKEKLLAKARKQGILGNRNEADMTEKEIYNLITLPGFSTNEQVTEYSGRGVGMDVVVQNLAKVGGTLDIESEEGKGSSFIMKIPLTLAIIEGIVVDVGRSSFVMATGNISEFISITEDQIITDPSGDEGVMIRGNCYPLIRLKRFFNLPEGADKVTDGILMVVEYEGRKVGLLVDKLVGEQEIVVKPLPAYLKKVKGISSCTQLGDGSISLIIDPSGLFK